MESICKGNRWSRYGICVSWESREKAPAFSQRLQVRFIFSLSVLYRYIESILVSLPRMKIEIACVSLYTSLSFQTTMHPQRSLPCGAQKQEQGWGPVKNILSGQGKIRNWLLISFWEKFEDLLLLQKSYCSLIKLKRILFKDIRFLAHEPIINKFRAMKIFAKKLRKAIDKRNKEKEQTIRNNEPTYRLDHIVKERWGACASGVFFSLLRDIRKQSQLVKGIILISPEGETDPQSNISDTHRSSTQSVT